MLRKYLFTALGSFALVMSASVVAYAQTGELRGHVLIKDADGKTSPASEAAIDVFRTDLPGKYNTKTNKKGEFVFAGLPFVGTYVVAVSHPSGNPTFQPGVKVGRDVNYEIVMSPGDGRRLTEAEVKAAASGGGSASSAPAAGGSSESKEDKAKREELEKKNREIEAGNKKIEAVNATIARTFKAGNEALVAKNYDEAIKQYEEGLAADAEQPALLTNKAAAYKARGVERYNSAITGKDEAAKAAGLEGAKSDFKTAAEATTKAVELLKAQQTPTDAAEQARFNANKLAAMTTRAEAMRLFVTKVDGTQADAGLAAFKDLIAAETDPAKKSKAQLDAAQMLLDSGAVDKALAEFQAVLTTQPDSADANLGAGLSLFASGDKAKYQEAANYLQHFVDVAPDAHKFKADAKAILAELKNTEKVVPEKTTTPPRRRRP